jgi:hypothetical protein
MLKNFYIFLFFILLPTISLGSVEIINQIKGDCWTNVNEVKDYAEDKLLLNGDQGYIPGIGWINIHVDGNRYNGVCFASIMVVMYNYSHQHEEEEYPIILKQVSKTAKSVTNINRTMIEVLYDMF